MKLGGRRLLVIAGAALLGGAALYFVFMNRAHVFREKEAEELVDPEEAPRSPLYSRILLPRETGPETDETVFGDISDIAVDAQGNIYVVDRRLHRVMKFDSTGNFLQQIGRPGQGPGELLRPYAIDLDERGFIYVFDVGNSRVQVYTPDGRYHSGFPVPRAGAGGYQTIAVGSAGEVYLNLPLTGYLVSVFSAEGEKLREFGALEPYPFPDVLAFNAVILRIDRRAGVLHVIFPKLSIYRKYTTDGRLLFSKKIQSSWMRSRYRELSREQERRRRQGDKSIRWVEFLRSACVLPDHSLLISVPVKPGERDLCQFSPDGSLRRRFFPAPAEADTVSLDCMAAFRGNSIRVAFGSLFLGLVGLLEERR